LFITNKLNLLIRKFASKCSRNKIISCNQYKQDKINNNKDKSIKNKNVKKKNICNANVNKIMQINNTFSTNMLMFCDKENKNKSLKLSNFKRLKNIKN